VPALNATLGPQRPPAWHAENGRVGSYSKPENELLSRR
jgi:hypothetical protein